MKRIKLKKLNKKKEKETNNKSVREIGIKVSIQEKQNTSPQQRRQKIGVSLRCTSLKTLLKKI